MKKIFFLLLTTIPLFCLAQQPGFRKLYNGETTGATFVDLVWDGEKLFTTGQFLTDTAPNNALNGLLYMELDTNGNTIFTDIYFQPNDAVTPQIDNSIFKSNNGLIYTMGQILDITSSYLSIYNESGRVSTVVIPVDGLQSWLFHCVDWGENILLSGRRSTFQYHSEGMLIKSDPMGNELWRKYYGSPGVDCEIAEPYIVNNNTILLPGYKGYWPSNGPIINKWTKTRILTVDSLGNTKAEWESPKNIENGVATRMLKIPDGNWLYTTSEFIPMPGQIDNFGLHPKIVCRDSSFNLMWERYLPAVPTSACYSIDLQATSDGNFIVVGFLNDSEWWGAQVIYKFAPNGDSIWMYRDYCNPTFGCYHYLGGVAELPGGSIVAAGYYENIEESKVYGLLIKLDKNGCMDTLCGVDGTYESELASKIKVYPNPASDVLTVNNPIGNYIEIFDMEGRLVRFERVNGDTQTISLEGIASGAYVVRMQEKTLRVSYQIIKI